MDPRVAAALALERGVHDPVKRRRVLITGVLASVVMVGVVFVVVSFQYTSRSLHLALCS
jgi:hypothetical protein